MDEQAECCIVGRSYRYVYPARPRRGQDQKIRNVTTSVVPISSFTGLIGHTGIPLKLKSLQIVSRTWEGLGFVVVKSVEH